MVTELHCHSIVTEKHSNSIVTEIHCNSMVSEVHCNCMVTEIYSVILVARTLLLSKLIIKRWIVNDYSLVNVILSTSDLQQANKPYHTPSKNAMTYVVSAYLVTPVDLLVTCASGIYNPFNQSICSWHLIWQWTTLSTNQFARHIWAWILLFSFK